MSFRKKYLITICFMLVMTSIKSQSLDDEIIDPNNYRVKILTDSGYQYVNFFQRTCKGYGIESCYINHIEQPVNSVLPSSKVMVSSFAKIKGYISYEYYYNQRIDTPYAATAYEQHTVSGQLKVTLKDKYPFNVTFTTRQTNNQFFRNFFDVGFLFDKYTFSQLRKEDYLKKISVDNPLEKIVKSNLQAIKKAEDAYNQLFKQVDEKTITQAIVHEREQLLEAKLKKPSEVTSFYLKDSSFKTLTYKGKEFQGMIPGDTVWQKSTTKVPNWINDSVIKTPTEKWYEDQVKKLKDLKATQGKLIKYNDSLKNEIAGENQSFAASFGDYTKWKIHKKKYGDKTNNSAGKLSTVLDDIKTLGIGRSNIDFSELTVRNLNLTGLQVEYQPDLYYAIAGGKIDYSFRDFFISNNNPQPKQEFYIARLGVIRENKSSLIISTFSGKKNTYLANNLVANNFTGYSILGKIYLGKENFIESEIAKTTPARSIINENKPATLLGFNDNSNMGFTTKLHLNFPHTRTLLEGYYRKIGYAFQSINLFRNTLNQSAWSAKAEQKIFNNVLKLTVALKKNDFTYPSVTQNFNSNTVFKTFKLDVRKKAFFLSVGYFPGTQLIQLDSSKIAQNLYYMFNSTAGYTKKVGAFYSSTIVNYNLFINQSTDTGFVYYRGKSIQLSQSLSSNMLVLQAGFTSTNQPSLNYYTVESSVEISRIKWLSFGVGIKYNKVKYGNGYLGGTGNATITLGHWATLRASYDQLYIPSKNNELSKADLGRIILIKYL